MSYLLAMCVHNPYPYPFILGQREKLLELGNLNKVLKMCLFHLEIYKN